MAFALVAFVLTGLAFISLILTLVLVKRHCRHPNPRKHKAGPPNVDIQSRADLWVFLELGHLA